MSRFIARTLIAAALIPCLARAQGTGPGLVVPVPTMEQVRVRTDSFSTSTGTKRRFDVYRPAATADPVPVVVFANGNGPQLREWNSYVGWARLVTSRGMAGVLYEGPTFDASKSLTENLTTSRADLDSLLTRLSATAGASVGERGLKLESLSPIDGLDALRGAGAP